MQAAVELMGGLAVLAQKVWAGTEQQANSVHSAAAMLVGSGAATPVE